MDHLSFSEVPELTEPVLVAGFTGWGDAGEAGSGAVRYLRQRWGGRPLARIDPEVFFDFTQHRPEVHFDADGRRRVRWPDWTFWWARSPGGRDVVFLEGPEPHLRWRTFCDQVMTVVDRTDVSVAVTCGALLADVTHDEPVRVIGVTYDAALDGRLGLTRSRYEGPTGIVGVLHDRLGEVDVPSASLWAAVPSYVPAAPSPKATLALVVRLLGLLEEHTPTTELEIAAAAYERQVSDLVDSDEDLREYVAAVRARRAAEPDEDADPPLNAEGLVEEVERFLRDHGTGDPGT